jgi:hypothetical protein
MEPTGMEPVVRTDQESRLGMRSRAIAPGNRVLRAGGMPSMGPLAMSWEQRQRARADNPDVSFHRWMWVLWCSEGHCWNSCPSRRRGSLRLSTDGADRRDRPKHAMSRDRRVLSDPSAGEQHVYASPDKPLMKR